ncbi:MAG: DNA-directed RNA polymerase subunit omega [Candidatus Hydrogenedentes bacterium]|nr:DNA-directed RNA polymerase subunit omega [Candidatus Hydrogenedentota bacterium]
MSRISVEMFEGKIDSLYRLVILGAKRASQLSKPEARPMVRSTSRKPTMVALEEVLADKLKPRIGGEEDETYLE